MRRVLAAAAAALCAACAVNQPGVDPEEFGRIEFQGNTTLERAELLGAAVNHLRDYTDRDVGKAAIDDAAYRIELFYKDRGFAFAEVDYAIQQEGLGVDRQARPVRFVISEGPRVRLTELTLDGGGALDEGRMRELAVSITGEPGEADFVERSLSRAANAVLAEARVRGYFEAEVDVRVLELDRVDAVGRAELALIPGPRHVLDAMTFQGEELPDDVRQGLLGRLGEPFEPRSVATMLAHAAEELRDAGYPDATVEIVEREADAEGRVRLVLRSRLGELVHVAAIRFDGEMDTRSSYLEDLVGLEPGMRYSASEVRAAAQRIYGTGLFQTVDHRLEPETGPERDLVFQLVELPSLEIWVEPGWGSYDGPRVRAGLREHNLVGTGWILRTEGVLSAKTKTAEVGVTDPVFLMHDLSLDVGLQYARREEPSFEFEEGGLRTSVARRWSDSLTTTIGYRFKRSNLIADDLDLIDPDEIPSDFNVSAIELKAVNDTRDNLLSPHAGARIELSGEWADTVLGSELDFLRGTFTGGLFTELSSDLVLATRGSFGAIVPTNDTLQIPLQERFFLGGENTVRSFGESDLGPKDSAGEPIGGEAYTLLSVELRQGLPRNFEVAAFADAGNLQSSYSDLFGGEDYRFALGLGLRYELPVGALRLDAGWNPNPQDDEDDYALHFSLGQAF